MVGWKETGGGGGKGGGEEKQYCRAIRGGGL